MTQPEPAFDQFNPIYQIAFENINQGFCLIEKVEAPPGTPPDFRYLLTNQAFEQHAGLKQVVGKTLRQVVPAIDEQIPAYYEQVARLGATINFETYVATLGRWIDTRAFRVEADNPRRIAVLFMDITTTKQAQADRHQSQAQAKFLLQLSDAMRSLTDPISMQLTATRLAQDYFQADRAYYCEIDGDRVTVRQQATQPDLPAIPPQYSLDQFPRMKTQLLKGKAVVVSDATTEGLDASLKQLCKRLTIGAYIQVPLIRQGQLVAKFCLTQARPRSWTSLDRQLAIETAERIWDVTQRARTEAASRESEAKYHLLFESIDEGFCQIQLLYDAQGQPIDWLYLEANPTFERQIGVNPVGQRVSQVVGAVEAHWLAFYHQVALSGQPARTENYVSALDRWYTIYASPVGATADQLTVVSDDCTARKQLEAALRGADQRKDEFLAMLAHELRNPLATLRSGLQLLTLTEGSDASAQATLTMMNRQTNQLVRLVDDLLDVSRISQGKISIRQQRVELVDLVGQTAEDLRPLFAQRDLDLKVSLPASPVHVVGDETRLGQVVTNLLTNAARYTPSGGQVWLNLSHSADALRAILEVEDTGIGLAADQLKSIFALFVQVDNSPARSQGGLGVGLTLVQRLVSLHGGEVWASSPGLGQGSRFSVELPMLAAERPSKAVPDELVAAAGGLPRILLIDDNADAGLIMRMLLERNGYEVHTRSSGRAGLAALASVRPAVVLLDIGMPDLDGYSTCRLMREQAWGRSVVIVALTGYGQAGDRQRSQAAGFDGHLVKPIDLGSLTDLLTHLLAGRNKSL